MQQPIEIRAEDALLYACARTKVDRDTSERIQELLGQGIDWTYLTQRAIYHRVAPLVYQTLRQDFADRVRSPVIAEFQDISATVVRKNLFLLTRLVRLLEWLEAEGIEVIPYKGPALSVLAYGNFGLRQFGDLDILVRPDQFRNAVDLLLSRGFHLGSKQLWELTLVDAADGASVDIHQAITPPNFPVKFDFHALHGRLHGIPVAGRTIKTFSPEDMLIVLCVQLAKDAWGTNILRLSKICDIAELLRSHPDLDWAFVLEETQRLGCEYILSFGLSVSRELLDADVPALALRTLPRRSFDILFDHIKDKLVNQNAPFHPGLLTSSRVHFMIRERWRDKFAPHLYYCKRAVLPNELDYAFVNLPGVLHPLYYLIRPVRLLQKKTVSHPDAPHAGRGSREARVKKD
jgi:hypothetical protein